MTSLTSMTSLATLLPYSIKDAKRKDSNKIPISRDSAASRGRNNTDQFPEMLACQGCGLLTGTRLCCPDCKIHNRSTFFCSQECFDENWSAHCELHKILKIQSVLKQRLTDQGTSKQANRPPSCQGCGMPTRARLCCPQCRAFDRTTVFCSQSCFADNWAKHCELHELLKLRLSLQTKPSLKDGKSPTANDTESAPEASCQGCGLQAGTDLCCPDCAALDRETYFCSQQCFDQNWAAHSELHKLFRWQKYVKQKQARTPRSTSEEQNV
eukprot:c16181_g2_i1.p1 GENE.c16181_g2_i1~~c16181_g2_i1.p1  ORF type:complete len:268 (+),score=16.80 c16181_g2_i1:825-1628(+)